MSDRARLLALRQRLHETLRQIAEHADALAQERCPHRGAQDVCYLGRGCRNQRVHADARYCSGAQLDYHRP